MAADTLLNAYALDVRVPGRVLVENLDLELRRGEFVAILGKNGAGKTLTLHTLAGLRAPDAGDVSLAGTPIAAQSRVAVARRLALLTQTAEDIFPASVLDTALIGRHPHIGTLQWETADDREIAVRALAAMDLDELRDRDVLTLSGGERRRLAAAQVLAQDPDVYLLDEPTNHLDPQHQLDLLDTFRSAVNGNASAVIASLHDVNLAARYADRRLLLFGDGRWKLGPTREILDEAELEGLYGTPMDSVPWRDGRLFVASPR